VKPASFDYLAPDSLGETLALLAEHGEDGKILAGGQSLVPLMNLRLARPETVLDINGVAGLGEIRRENGSLVLGALVRQADAEHDATVAASAPLVAKALRYVGHVAIRSRGTVAGSIAHADPAAELPAVFVALDGEAVALSRDGERRIPAAEFFTTLFTTALREDELLSEVRLPAADGTARSAFVEIARRHGDFALVGAAVSLAVEDGVVSSARIVLSGVADVPLRAVSAEVALVGARVGDEAAYREAGRRAEGDVRPRGDVHASAEYRKEVAGVLVERAVAEALKEGSDHGN
jgi:aerobic carbon-monoxide dehydrogenase medium subunit